MKKSPLKKRKENLRAVIGTGLASASLFQLAFPLIANAEGIAAGTTISNTATATYEDGKGTTVNATSNTVQVTVAEVAGIANRPVGVVDSNGGSYEVNDLLEFKFQITNTGNSTTHFAIPNAQTLINDGALIGVSQNVGDVVISAVKSDGTTVMGLSAYNTNYSVTNDTIAPDDYITVTVQVKVTATIAGDDIAVRFGDIPPNDNTSGTQNQAFSADTQKNDVYTVDAPDVAGSEPFDVADDSAGAPINGEREAGAYQKVDLATQAQKLALAKIKKTGSITATNGVAGNDDEITFNLSLEVLNTSPDATFTPADLAGTPIRLDSADATRILLSDVVPAGTVLSATPTPPNADWKVVYSTNDPATTIPVKSTDVGALPAAEWTTTAPALNTVKRIGFIYEPSTATTDAEKNATKIAQNTSVSPFSFKVLTSGLQAIGGSVYNVAQVFGTTDGGNGEVVYDESGDNNANNFENSTPPDSTGTKFDPANNTGIADPDLDNNGTEDNVDTEGNNTGSGAEGEVLKIQVIGTVISTDDILNGPAGQPAAVGPNSDNDDYTNVTTAVPANVPEGTNISDPQTQTITNTVGVKTGVTKIDNITLEPIAPSLAEANAGGSYYGTNADIPNGTLVTITYDPTPANPSSGDEKTATYIYDQVNGEFDLQTGTPVNIGTLSGGQTANYTVTITIPANSVDPLTSVSVPIIAFPDDGNRETSNTDNSPISTGTGVAYTGEAVNNITIDRLYTGFMRLVKEARILNTDGTPKSAWSNSPTHTTKAAPGEIIEYRITYTNISEPPQGTGNVSLTAQNFKLVENGNAELGTTTNNDNNNWATTTTHRTGTLVQGVGSSGTVNYYGSSTPAGVLSSLIGQTDPSNGTKVDAYENIVPSIAPGASGTFQFRRMVNLGLTPTP